MVALTRLMLMQPKLWLLDEPTASMDSGSEERCLSALKAAMRSNHTAVIVTHKPALLKLVNRVIVVTAQGVVLDGPRDEVLMRLGASAKAKPKAAALHRLKPVA